MKFEITRPSSYLQPWSVGIKYANYVRVHLLIAVVRHGCGLGESFGLIIYRSQSDRIHVSQMGLLLRMFPRVTVTLRSRSQQELSFVFLCDFKAVQRADRTDSQRLDAMLQVVHGLAGDASERCS